MRVDGSGRYVLTFAPCRHREELDRPTPPEEPFPSAIRNVTVRSPPASLTVKYRTAIAAHGMASTAKHARPFRERQHPFKASVNAWLCQLAHRLVPAPPCTSLDVTLDPSPAPPPPAWAFVLDSACLTTTTTLLSSGIVASPQYVLVPNPAVEVGHAMRLQLPDLLWVPSTSHAVLEQFAAGTWAGDPRPGPFAFVYLDYCGNLTSRSGQHRLRDLAILFEQQLLGRPGGRCLLAVTAAERGTAAVHCREQQGVDELVTWLQATAARHGYAAHCLGVVHYFISAWMDCVAFLVAPRHALSLEPLPTVAECLRHSREAAASCLLDAEGANPLHPNPVAAADAAAGGDAPPHNRRHRLIFHPAWPPPAVGTAAAPFLAQVTDTLSTTNETGSVPPLLLPPSPASLAPPPLAGDRPLGRARARVADTFAALWQAQRVRRSHSLSSPTSAAASPPDELVLLADSKFSPVAHSLLRARVADGASLITSGRLHLALTTGATTASSPLPQLPQQPGLSSEVHAGPFSAVCAAVTCPFGIGAVFIDYGDAGSAKSPATMKTAATWRDLVALFRLPAARFHAQWLLGIFFNYSGTVTACWGWGPLVILSSFFYFQFPGNGLPWVDAQLDWLLAGVNAVAAPAGWHGRAVSVHGFVSGVCKNVLMLDMRACCDVKGGRVAGATDLAQPLRIPCVTTATPATLSTAFECHDTASLLPAGLEVSPAAVSIPGLANWVEVPHWDPRRPKVPANDSDKYHWAAEVLCTSVLCRPGDATLAHLRRHVALAEPGFLRALPTLVAALAPDLGAAGSQAGSDITVNLELLMGDDESDPVVLADLVHRQASGRVPASVRLPAPLSSVVSPSSCSALSWLPSSSPPPPFLVLLSNAGEGQFWRDWQRTIVEWCASLLASSRSPSLPSPSHSPLHEAHAVASDNVAEPEVVGVLTCLVASSVGSAVDQLVAAISDAVAAVDTQAGSAAGGSASLHVRPFLSAGPPEQPAAVAGATGGKGKPHLKPKYASHYQAPLLPWPTVMCACIRSVLVTLTIERRPGPVAATPTGTTA